MKRTEQYTEQLSRLYPELHQANEKEKILTQKRNILQKMAKKSHFLQKEKLEYTLKKNPE